MTKTFIRSLSYVGLLFTILLGFLLFYFLDIGETIKFLTSPEDTAKKLRLFSGIFGTIILVFCYSKEQFYEMIESPEKFRKENMTEILDNPEIEDILMTFDMSNYCDVYRVDDKTVVIKARTGLI